MTDLKCPHPKQKGLLWLRLKPHVIYRSYRTRENGFLRTGLIIEIVLTTNVAKSLLKETFTVLGNVELKLNII